MILWWGYGMSVWLIYVLNNNIDNNQIKWKHSTNNIMRHMYKALTVLHEIFVKHSRDTLDPQYRQFDPVISHENESNCFT